MQTLTVVTIATLVLIFGIFAYRFLSYRYKCNTINRRIRKFNSARNEKLNAQGGLAYKDVIHEKTFGFDVGGIKDISHVLQMNHSVGKDDSKIDIGVHEMPETKSTEVHYRSSGSTKHSGFGSSYDSPDSYTSSGGSYD